MSENVNSNNQNSKQRAKPVKATDLAIRAMMQGVDSLDETLASYPQPVELLEKVRKLFEQHGKDCTDLDEKIAIWREAKEPGVKGRKPVSLGETRLYKGQKIGDDGSVFIRLPIDACPGSFKGCDVEVTFNSDGSFSGRVLST